MRLLFGLVLVAGLGLAAFAVHMAQGYIGNYQTALEQERAVRATMVETTQVYVAARALRYGETLTPQDVRTVQWPANAVPQGAFVDAATLFPEEEGDRVVLRTMEAGEAVLAVKITQPGEDAGVSARLSSGMRAFAIRVDVASGVSGFLRPGDRVDIYWTGRVNTSDGAGDVTKLIEPGVRIVAIDQSADEDRSNPVVARTVTVEADPQQVAGLAQAQSTGRLTLALVGAADNGTAETVQVDQRHLLGLKERKVVEVEKPSICTVRMRRGNEVVENPIPCSN